MKTLNKLTLLGLLFVSGLAFGQNKAELMNWWHKSPGDGFTGIASQAAYDKLIKNNGQTIVVAIIDSGIDVEHPDLKDNIWTNPGEIPDNGIDDDKNGYIDDVHGWNFIGGPNGKNVGPDSYEVTRVYAKLKYKYENADPNKLNKTQKEEYELFKEAEKTVMEHRTSAEGQLKKIEEVESQIMSAIAKVGEELKAQNLSLDKIADLDTKGDVILTYGKRVVVEERKDHPERNLEAIKEYILFELASDKTDAYNELHFAYNPDFDPRSTIVMDNYADQTERIYGNNDVEGPDALHGTHVAGIVGAMRNNGIGGDGVATNVKLMSVRAVPDGDERDKDVANAIRYAVDNGASVINMSFGKGYKWDKELVNEAVKYAAEKDVLLVHAAGNSAANNDDTENAPNYPNDYLGKKGFLFFKKPYYAKNWIEVGALSYKGGEDAVARFSNYGKDNVDVFAPGVQIFAPVPNGQYMFLQGTSMASPVVAGVAAVLRSQFPALTADQVKEVIMSSTTPITGMVKKPGSGELVPFSSLSITGGVVNLQKAMETAATVKGKKKVVAPRGA